MLMGKFVAPVSEASGYYLTAEERDALIASGEPLTVVEVRTDLANTYKGRPSPRYMVTFNIDGEERGWGFGIGSSDGSETSRDRLFIALQEYLGQEDAEVTQVVVGKSGTFITVEVPEEAE